MGNKIIEYIIGAKDATANAINSALNRIKSFAAGVGSNLQNIRAGFAMLGTAANKAVEFMRKAFRFETMTVQFKTFIGSMDEARDHMKMLQELGDTPPFSLEEFAAASRSLMVMTDGALGFRKSLELVGDAAAATGQPIQSLAHEVGRAYAIIRDGQPLTRATMALRNMGVLTPEVAQKLQDLQNAGASTTEIWQEMEKALSRYKGAMEETEKTGEGLMGAISAQWDDTLREFGAACLETSKDALGGLLDWMKQLREDGSIAVWANNFGKAMEKVAEWCKDVVDGMKAVGNGISWLYEHSGLSDLVQHNVGGVQGSMSAIGTLMGGGSIKDAAKAFKDTYAEEMSKGFYSNKLMGSGLLGEGAKKVAEETRKREAEALKEEADEEEKIRAAAKERQKKSAAETAQKKLDEEKKVQDALAEGQRKIDEREAENAAKKYAEEYAKWEKQVADQEERDRIEAERAIAAERQRLWNEDMRQRQADLAVAQQNESEAQQRLAAAQQESARAWGWYRNRDSWKSQLEEERANAEAERQFEKDAASLKRKTRWRTRTLNDDDELVRRVVLAREEEQAAQEYARQTAEATARAADALEEINNTLTGGGDE